MDHHQKKTSGLCRLKTANNPVAMMCMTSGSAKLIYKPKILQADYWLHLKLEFFSNILGTKKVQNE